MIRHLFHALGLLALLAVLSHPVLAASDSPAGNSTLCVMTFNLRFASPKPPNSWPERRPVVRDCIRGVAPDVIGTQEGVYYQLRDIAADQPEYDWVGLGREGGSRGEFMAVFFRKDRLEPLEYDHYWLSDTPMVMGSKTWGPTLPRMVTWMKFRDKRTDQQFYFINTHFDHQVQIAREKSSELVRKQADRLNPNLPVILLGDFNAAAKNNKAYEILTAGENAFIDTWFTARERRGEDVATFHGYNPPIKDGPHIDWILTRGAVAADATQIITYQQNGQYPSDHFPVAAWVRIGQSQQP